jgi:hypothetical protein
MDYERRHFERGRPPDVAGDAVTELLYYFWLSIKGKPPGISRPYSGGPVGGPFVRFVGSMAAEILADLKKVAPLGQKRPAGSRENALRTSLRQLALRPEKVCERLKTVRRFWLLPSLDGGILQPQKRKPTKKARK